MIDRDKPSKSFLERWSRKKIESEREASDPSAEPRTTDVAQPDEPSVLERPAADDAKAPVEPAAKPDFDFASLPSLDSITAATDIRAFLGSGVPKELARAALRRAWSADPAIRDFKGLAENDWDFTDPAAMPGFGALPPGTDIKKMLAQIFGEGEKPADPDDAPVERPAAQESAVANAISAPPEAPPSANEEEEPSSPPTAAQGKLSSSDVVQRDNNIARHNSIRGDGAEEQKTRHPHGSALPQ
jgi:hypothetical protein